MERALMSPGKSFPVFLAACSAVALLSVCSPAEGGAGGPAEPATASGGVVQHLEGWFGERDGLRGEASYKEKRASGGLEKELKIEVEHAKAGAKHAVTLDGFTLGQIITDLDGEAEFELTGDAENFLPAGCPEPKAGAVIQVGDLMTLQLGALERVVDLEAVIQGPGKLAGKVSFRFDRLGEAESKEFQIKVSGGPANTVQAVTVGGVAVGELSIEDDGKGKLEYSSRKGRPFPAGFVDPTAGTALQIGTAFSGELLARRGS
jgi:hypothetical protein